MIKFVCGSCGERLSVPDEHGGRKGLCPTCHAVNRIPLKGFAETKPNVPTIARPDGALMGSPTPASPEPVSSRSPSIAQATEEEPIELEPDDLDPSHHSNTAPASANHAARDASIHSAAPRPPEATSDEPVPHIPALFTTPTDPEPDVPLQRRKERRLPRPIKILLLVIAALAIVAGLYFGLYYSLHALLHALTPPG